MVCSHLVFDNTSHKIVKPLIEKKGAGFKEILFLNWFGIGMVVSKV